MTAAFKSVRSAIVPLRLPGAPQGDKLADDVDTDQIIPARFLKVIDKDGLADGLFAEWKKDPGFVLHEPRHKGSQILFAGRNFGCGSSREHAPWALLAGGFRCVIALGFADIFRGNALRNGVLPVALSPEAHADLEKRIAEDPRLEVEVDLESQTVRWGDRSETFPVDGFAKHCLLQGIDELGYIAAYMDKIQAFERRHDAEVGL